MFDIYYIMVYNIIVKIKGDKENMNIYTIKFYCNGKKYGYRGTNYKVVKKIQKSKKCKVVLFGYFNYNDL